MKIPVCILSFNRPSYLEVVLKSIKSQIDIDLRDFDFNFFQDGAVNPFSGKRKAQDGDIESCVRLFKEYFPDGNIFLSEKNLGVALNFERAENFAFGESEAPYSIFLEDDLELNDIYFKNLTRLTELALRRDDVGYISAYGNHHAPLTQQSARHNDVILMGHNWGFALTRQQWLKSAPFVNQYLDLVRSRDYSDRPADEICRLFQSWGAGAPGTSQDVAKSLACYLTGGVKINTYPVFARYIGEQGLHMTPEAFDRLGFQRTEWCNDDIFHPDELSDQNIASIRSGLGQYVQENYQNKRQSQTVEQNMSSTSVDLIKPTATRPEEAASSTPAALTPSIRMTPKEIELLIRHLKSSQAYLEFGAGGSTQLAIEHARGRIVTVESDAAWVEKLKADPKVKAAIDARRLSFMHIDIGPVGDWGVPRGETRIKHWKDYFSAPWISLDIPFDLVLIDGRFRIMCALMAAAYASDETRIAIHDYGVRKHYFVIEKYFDTIETADTLVILKRRKNINYMSWSSDILKHFFDFG